MSPVVSHSALSTGGVPGVIRSRKSILAISAPLSSDQRSPVMVAGFAEANVTVLVVGGVVFGPPDLWPTKSHGLASGSPHTSPVTSTVTR